MPENPLYLRSTFHSSGDPLADSRYERATGYRDDGDLAAAADLFTQAAERAPGWAVAWFALGGVRVAQGARAESRAAFQRALDADPTDELGAKLQLARLSEVPVADAIAAGYVAALFDQYATEFDAALVERLGYSGPRLLNAAIVKLCGPQVRFARCLDLGCGTGLAGAALRPLCKTLIGFDLSAGMLAQAARKGCYTELKQIDLLAGLLAEPAESANLVVAADSLVYVGELGPVFAAAARVLAPGGLFAATLEAGTEGIELHASLRYRHGPDHVRSRAAAAGLDVAALEFASARNDAGAPVPGFVAVLAKVAAVG